MKVCYKCGEYKKVRKVIDFDGKFLHIPNSILGLDRYYWYDYICEDCNKAIKSLKKKESIKEHKEWVKKRDKILKENSK